MSKYSCSFCNYTSIKRENITKHINRKNRCDPVNEPHIVVTHIELICECEKIFITKASFKKHQTVCKIANLKKDLEIANQKIKEMEETNQKAKESIVNNNNININIDNSIKIAINGYNDTDLSKITDKQYLHALNRMCLMIPAFIKDVHFNPNIAENKNIYISNMRNGYVMVYNSETKNWDARPKDEMINKLITDREYDIQEWLDCDKYPKAKQKFNEYLEKKEADNVQKMIKDEIELILYNNRNMVAKTK
jgi:hypothetical protein